MSDLNFSLYSQYFQYDGEKKWMKKIWKNAFGSSYPEGLEHYGYITNEDIDLITNKLRNKHIQSMLDVGCGKGGPGLHIAETLGIELTGIDIVPDAVRQANLFKGSFNLKYPAHFLVGQFNTIPLADASMDAAISIDSLWTATDKIRGLTEMCRVLKPGGKCIFTHWDLHTQEAIPLFEMSGLRFIDRQETPNWIENQRAVYEGIKTHIIDLVEEMGKGANMLLYEASASPAYLDLSVRRIYEMEKPSI